MSLGLNELGDSGWGSPKHHLILLREVPSWLAGARCDRPSGDLPRPYQGTTWVGLRFWLARCGTGTEICTVAAFVVWTLERSIGRGEGGNSAAPVHIIGQQTWAACLAVVGRRRRKLEGGPREPGTPRTPTLGWRKQAFLGLLVFRLAIRGTTWRHGRYDDGVDVGSLQHAVLCWCTREFITSRCLGRDSRKAGGEAWGCGGLGVHSYQEVRILRGFPAGLSRQVGIQRLADQTHRHSKTGTRVARQRGGLGRG
jgi:hypothetical protein